MFLQLMVQHKCIGNKLVLIVLSDGTTTDNYTVGNTLLFSATAGLTSTILDDTVRYY